MNSAYGFEEGLRDGDVFTLFIDFLSEQKTKNISSLIDFDEIIYYIALAQQKLTQNYSLPDNIFNYRFSQGNRDLEDLTHQIYSNYLYSNVSSNAYSFEEFNEKEHEYIKNELNRIYNAYFYNGIVTVLEKYLSFFESFGFIKDTRFVKGFSLYMKFLNKSIDSTRKIDNNNEKFNKVLSNIISPFFYKRLPEISSQIFRDFINEDIFSLTRDISFAQESDILKSRIYGMEDFIDDSSSELAIIVGNDDEVVSELFLPFYLISKTFESVKGVKVEMVSIGKGSLFSKLLIRFKDLVAKEESKTILKIAAEIATKKLTDTSISEVNKNYVETDKTRLEIEALQKEITASLPYEQLKEKNQLQLERERLENEKLKREVNILEIDEAIKRVELIDKLSTLLSKAIIETDQLQISLDGLPIIVKKDGKLEIGDIDQALS